MATDNNANDSEDASSAETDYVSETDSRRKFLELTGAGLGVMGMSSFAGCTGGGGGQSTTNTDGSAFDQQKAGGSLTVTLGGQPTNLFGMKQESVASSAILSVIHTRWAPWSYEESKMRTDNGGITDWEWQNDTTLRAHVREGMQFHRGYGEVTAEDFVYQGNRVIDEGLAAIFLWSDRAKRLEQVDKYTFDIHFSSPFTPFVPVVFPQSFVHSKAAIEEMGDQKYSSNPVGSGPYKFEEWSRGSFVRVSKFEDYWGEGGYADEITFKIVPDANTRQNLLESGGADVLDRANYSNIDQMKKRVPKATIDETPGWNFEYMLVGGENPVNETAGEALNNRKVRRAVAFAVNRNALVKQAFFGHARADDDPAPQSHDPLLPDGDPSYFPNSANKEKARQLLKDAGYGDGFKVQLKHTNKTEKIRSAQIVASNLNDIGLDAELQQVDAATMENITDTGDYDIAYADITILGPDLHPTAYWFWRSDAGINSMGYENQKVDELLGKQLELTDQKKRAQIFQQLYDIVIPDAPFIYTGHINLARVLNEGVHLDKYDTFGSQADNLHRLKWVWKE